MSDNDDCDLQRFPLNFVDFERNPWYFQCSKSHILSSKCTGPKSEGCDPEEGETSMCQFCAYTQKLSLPHLPDMVFASNIFSVTNNTNKCLIEFNAFDALALVSNGKMSVEVACSEEWKDSRNDTGHTKTVFKPFDWTFSTNYKGTLKGNWKVEATETRIDLDRLRRKDAILFFQELTIFEDELHDNGISQLSLKVRVMPDVFFILLRYFLRVDGVLVQINDTRYYHDYSTNYIIREFTSREAKVADLTVPPSLLLDPNDIAPKLPIVKEINEKLTPSDS